jgi:hypothetical protein
MREKGFSFLRFLPLLLFPFSLFPGIAQGQASTRDTAVRISSITLDNQNVFDSTDHSLPARVQNLLHARTRAPLIRREFLFHVGEPYDSARVAETERNLRRLGTFKQVTIDTVRSDSGMAIHVTTRELVTAQLQIILKGSGSSLSWGLIPLENNLFGTLTHAELGYRHDPDRNTTKLGFSQRRLIGNEIGGTAEWFHRSDGTIVYGQLTKPYFEASSRSSATLTFDDRRVRILQFRFGDPAPVAVLQDRYLLGRADYGRAVIASPRRYVRLGATVQVRRDDYVTDSLYQQAGFPVRSMTGAFGVYAEASRINKPKVFAFQSLSSEEDVDLSTTVAVSLFAAPAKLGYDNGHSGIAPGISLHSGLQFPHGFVYADGYARGLYTASGLDSGSVGISATAVWMPQRRHQLLVHGEANALKNPLPGTEFDLGFGSGPRAFRQHSFTGDREFFVTGEYRITVGLDVLKLADLGIAAFVDDGGAWWAADPVRSGWDAGIGLRAAFGHALVNTSRLDLAWRGAKPGISGGWTFFVGTGLAFSTLPRGAQ